MGDTWINCQACGHRYGSWITSCPKCGNTNSAYKARRSKGGIMKKVGIGAGAVIAVLIILAVIGSAHTQQAQTMDNTANSQGIQNTSPVTTSPQAQQEPTVTPIFNSERTVGVNQTIMFNDVALKVTKVSKVTALPFWRPDGVYLVIHMNIENQGKEKADVGSLYKLKDAQGRIFEASNAAESYTDWIAGKELNPGLKTTGTVIFDIPKTTIPTEYKLSIANYNENPTTFIDIGAW